MLKETKEAIHCLIMFLNAVGAGALDAMSGKPNILKDVFAFVPALMALPGAVSGAEKIPDELKAASAADKTELANQIATEFSIPFPLAEQYIEQAIAVLIQMWVLSSAIQKKA